MRKADAKSGQPRRFTALLERDGKWFIASCPEVPGANGQGRTKAECLGSLVEAIKLMLEIQDGELASLTQGGVERCVVEVA